jgi:hypothetical protein
MKLFDVYKNKKTNELIQIQCFASHMNNWENNIIVFCNIEKHNDFEIGLCPSFNGYGTQAEIEDKFELFVPQEDLQKYQDSVDL